MVAVEFWQSLSPFFLRSYKTSLPFFLRSQDRFVVSVWVTGVTAARLVIGHRIHLMNPQQHATTSVLPHQLATAVDEVSAGGLKGPLDRSDRETASHTSIAPASAPEANTLILESEGVVVWLNSDYRPVRIPANVRAVFSKLAARFNPT